MSVLRFHGPVLPDGQVRDLYVVDGRISYQAHPAAETAASGWIVPGLVDAHCHVGLSATGGVSVAETEQQALQERAAGVLLLRDCGSPVDTRWIDDREDLPRIVRAGRHLARTHRYLRGYAHEVEPGDLVAHVVREAQYGDGWVKLVGDWIDRGVGDLAPSFPAETFAAAIKAAHEHGARVTAHCFGEEVLPMLIEAGIDCIEHGTGLSADLIDAMLEHRVALVPTVVQLDNFPMYAEQAGAKFPAYARHMRDLHARRKDTVRAAYEAGVAIFAGTDAGGVLPHGGIAEEVLGLADYGFSAEDALAAASWRARAWLGRDAELTEGAPADFCVYPRDPIADLSVLREPTRIVLRGAIVA
jgi:imidazolonepropionase-like amidohydrolase